MVQLYLESHAMSCLPGAKFLLLRLVACCSSAEEVLIHLELMYFGAPRVPADTPAWEAALDFTNLQDYSALSNPTNPLCCGGTPGTPDQNVRRRRVTGGW